MCLFGTTAALEVHGRVWPKLVNHLTARAARGTGHAVIIRHGHGFDFNLRPQLGNGREDRGALGAIRHAVRSILHVAPGKYLPVCEKNRRSDVEIGIRGVRVLHHALSGSF